MLLKPPNDPADAPDPVTQILQWIDAHVRPIFLVGGPLADALSWIILKLASVIDWTTSIIVAIFNGAINALQVGLSWVNAAIGAVHSWADQIYYWTRDQVIPWLGGLINDVSRFAQAVLAEARAGFSTLWNSIASAVDSVTRWVVSNVWDPLWSWVSNAASIVGRWIDSAVRWVWDNLVTPVAHAVAQLLDLVSTLWDWFTHLARDAVELVVKAGPFLWWIVRHPWGVLGSMFDPGPSRGRGWVSDWAAAFRSHNAGLVDTFIAKWIDAL